MAEVTKTPRTVSFREEGYLLYGIDPADTSAVVAPVYKYVSGVRTKSGLSSTAGFGVIIEGNKVERFSFGAASVDSDKNTTITDVRRGLPQTGTVSNSTDLTAGTGLQFNRGAKIIVSDDPWFFRMAAYQDLQNTFTDQQIFDKGLRHTPFANTGARDAFFTAPTNGDECYVTGVGKQVYTAGSWVTTNSTSNTAATTTAAGTVEVGAVADTIAATGAGDSGAIVVIPTSLAKVASAGAGDSGKVLIRDTNGLIATTNLPNIPVANLNSGTSASSSTFWRGDGAWAAITQNVIPLAAEVADTSSIGASSTAELTVFSKTVNVSTYPIAAGDRFKVFTALDCGGITGTLTVRVKLAGQTAFSYTTTVTQDHLIYTDITVRTNGATGTATCGSHAHREGDVLTSINVHIPLSSIDFTANFAVAVTVQFDTSNGLNGIVGKQFTVDKFNAPS